MNCYNTGKIIAENTISEDIGSVIGKTGSSEILQNGYYLKGTYTKAIGSTSNSSEENKDVTELENLTDFPKHTRSSKHRKCL